MIADKAAALRKFAGAQGWSVGQRAEISEIEIRAVAKMGELLRETKGISRHGGDRKSSRAKGLDQVIVDGVTKQQSSRAQQVASVPAREREKYIAAVTISRSPTTVKSRGDWLVASKGEAWGVR